MIVPQKRQLWRMLHHVGLPLFMLIGWDVIVVTYVVVTYKVMHWWWIGSSVIPPALYGSAIGIIVGFRNNSAYTRWCEARTLWGAIVNDSRSLARQVCTAPHINPGGGSATDLKAMQTRIVHPQIAYVHALRQQLRQLDPLETIRDILAAEELNRLAETVMLPSDSITAYMTFPSHPSARRSKSTCASCSAKRISQRPSQQ